MFFGIAILPILVMVFNMFLAENAPHLIELVTLFSEERLLQLLLNSVIIAFGTSLLAIAIGVPLALFLCRTNIPFRGILEIGVLTPLLISPYIAALNWTSILGSQSVLNKFLVSVFDLQSAPLSLYNLFGVIFVLGFTYYPFVVLLTRSGLESIDRSYEEASLINRGYWSTLYRITIPLLRPFILAGSIFVFILSISNYGVPSLLRVNVYPVEIFIKFSAYYQEHVAVALALPILVITLTLIFLMKNLLGNRSYVTLNETHQNLNQVDLGFWKIPCLIAVMFVLFISPILPVLNLFIEASTLSSLLTAFQTAQMQIVNSFMMAAGAATLSTILGLVISYYIERRQSLFSKIVDLFSVVPFAFSSVIFGVGLIIVWNRSYLEMVYSSNAIIVLGYMAITLPFTIRIISAGLKQIHISHEEMFLINSGSWLSRMKSIIIPLCKPSLAISWCICFLLCMYELGIPLLVAPPGTSTLSIRIYTLLHYGSSQLVSALSLILILMGLIPVLILLWYARSKRGWKSFA